MMMVEVNGAWATSKDFDLPNGYYYLGNEANNNSVPKYDESNFAANFYMCPAYSATANAKNYLGGDSNKPLITTVKSFPKDGKTYLWAIWYIEAATGDNAGYFYIRHRDTEQYLVANDNEEPTAARRRVNLGPTTKPEGNDGLFKIQSDDDGVTYYIYPKEKHYEDNNGDNKYLSPSNGNKDDLTATNNNSNTGGILGFWYEKTKNSAWHFVNAQCATPTITFDKSNNSVTISTETTNAIVYYTFGSDPTDPTTLSTNNGTSTVTIENVTETTVFKAIAAMTNRVNSSVAFQKIVPEQTISVEYDTHSYTGIALEPTVTITGNGETKPFSSTEYEVTYSNNTNVGTATVTITDKPGGTYYIIGGAKEFEITKVPLTITANNNTITYGDAPAGNGVTYEGFVNSETTNVLGGTLGYDYSYTQYDDVGNTYTITPKGLTSNNYDISFVAGTLSVGQKEVGITWGETTSFVYDGFAHAPTATATGLVNNDAITVTITGAQTNVGGYIATASELAGEKVGNYKPLTVNTRSFTIFPKSLGDGDLPAEDITIKMTSEGELEYVKYGEITLTGDDEYTYEIHIEGPDKIVAITGLGNYTGSFRGIYANPQFSDVDGDGAGKAAAVYMSSRDINTFEGVDAYTVKSVNTFLGLLTVSKLEYIPKGVPVLLLSESEATGFVVSEKNENIADISESTVNSNLLKMAPAAGIPVETAQAYMFYLGEFVLTKAGTITSGKFYILNPNYKVNPADPSAAPVRRSLMIVEEETTDIANMPDTGSKLTDDVWYTLDGRRLSGKPVNKGLYIHHGRKTVIK